MSEESLEKRAIAPCPKSSDGQHKWGRDGQHQNEFCKHCYVPSLAELKKRDEIEATAILREELAKAKIANPEAYEWFDGEPLYRGDPILGRISPAEDQAYDATIKRLAPAEGQRRRS